MMEIKMKRLLLTITTLLLGLTNGDLLYSNTRLCSRHGSTYCLSYSDSQDLVILSRGKRLRFDIEQIENINLNVNRVYTYVDEVKMCLVKKTVSGDFDGITLAECGTTESELALSLSAPIDAATKPAHLNLNEFTLRTLNFLNNDGTISIEEETEPMCLTLTYTQDGESLFVDKKSHLKQGGFVALATCAISSDDEAEYAQEFKATYFSKSESAVSATSSLTKSLKKSSAEETGATVGRFCLTTQTDLCLGMSLTNGTVLESEKFVQVKNYTKNDIKGLDGLKMEWYFDIENKRVAAAAAMNYCLEAVYGAYMDVTRKGLPFYDNVVHLGACDANKKNSTGYAEEYPNLPSSEIFYTKSIITKDGSYMELRTLVPTGTNVTSGEQCATVVKCKTHGDDYCTRASSELVYAATDLVQGAHVRLKDCDSANLISQRFFYTETVGITVAPTLFPTPEPTEHVVTAEPTTARPTPKPTLEPTPKPTTRVTSAPTFTETELLTEVPTASPTVVEDSSGGKAEDPPATYTSKGSGLAVALAIVGVVCLAVLVVAVAYYYKHKRDFEPVNEEDENFIARV